MRRAWIVDLLTSLVMASMVGGIVLLFGAPPWAALGFGLLFYLLRPPSAQLREVRRRKPESLFAARRDSDA